MDSELVMKTAKLMAFAYWRGRMESMREEIEHETFEEMIAAAALHDVHRWVCAARAVED